MYQRFHSFINDLEKEKKTVSEFGAKQFAMLMVIRVLTVFALIFLMSFTMHFVTRSVSPRKTEEGSTEPRGMGKYSCHSEPVAKEEKKTTLAPQPTQQRSVVESSGKHVGRPVEFYYRLYQDGGLSNQRGVILQSLVVAANWGVKHVILPDACLKLTNIQVKMKKFHRYLPPYDYIRLWKGTIGYMYCGAFDSLWDVELLRRKLRDDFGITIHHEREQMLPRSQRQHDYSMVSMFVDFDGLSWDQALNRSIGSQDNIGALPNLFDEWPGERSPSTGELNSTTEEGKKGPLKILLKSTDHAKLLRNPWECYQMKHCERLMSALGPAPLIEETFLKQVKAALPKRFIAFHYRAYNCDQTIKGFERAAVHIQKLMKDGVIASDYKTMYVASRSPVSFFLPLEKIGFQVVNKELINGTFNMDRFPFEIMAFVDYEICRLATEVITLGNKGQSTFDVFLDIHRRQGGGNPVVFNSKNCV